MIFIQFGYVGGDANLQKILHGRTEEQNTVVWNNPVIPRKGDIIEIENFLEYCDFDYETFFEVESVVFTSNSIDLENLYITIYIEEEK